MGDDTTRGTRVNGVEFGPLKAALLEQEYPVTAAELVEQYGAFELELPEGRDRLEDALNRVDHAKFREPWEVRDAVLEGVSYDPAEPKTVDPSELDDPDDAPEDVDDWSQE